MFSRASFDEKGQRLLTILEAASQNVFEDLYKATLENTKAYRECLEKVNTWERGVISDELSKLHIFTDAEEVFRHSYIAYVKAMRSTSTT